ncbi:MAG: polysaccharide deacetylase family protein [Candidatus Ratteibacteria bacterium]|nr:polysaccharide deacetylase family protein [Candidatus Ratteibacteria bacterium]
MNIQFSFDDNHVLNMRVADLLEQYGFRATFFINIVPLTTHSGMTTKQIKLLCLRGHEIGAHTVNHVQLPLHQRGRRHHELRRGKSRLEKIIGSEVTGFSYPKGQYTDEIKIETEAAGYKYARATGEGNINPAVDVFAVIPTVQIYNSPLRRYLRIKRNLLEGTKFSLTGDWKKSCMKYIGKNEGIVHIWGHSWEIEKQGLWTEFEDLLKWIRNFNIEKIESED